MQVANAQCTPLSSSVLSMAVSCHQLLSEISIGPAACHDRCRGLPRRQNITTLARLSKSRKNNQSRCSNRSSELLAPLCQFGGGSEGGVGFALCLLLGCIGGRMTSAERAAQREPSWEKKRPSPSLSFEVHQVHRDHDPARALTWSAITPFTPN